MNRSHIGIITATDGNTALRPDEQSVPVTPALATRPPVPSINGVHRGMTALHAEASWRFDTFAGRLCEVSGDRASAALTLVFRLVHECQLRGEPTAWITLDDSVFFPPDVAATGVDLSALAVVRVADPFRATQVADLLLRSGAFGMLALDLGLETPLPLNALTRLSGLAGKHDTALLCITNKEPHQPSIGSLVSLRAQTERTERTDDRYRCEVHVIKDKRRGPGWTHREVCHGPDGLC